MSNSPLNSLIEMVQKVATIANVPVTDIINGLLDGIIAKQIAEQNSEGNHVKEAITYLNQGAENANN